MSAPRVLVQIGVGDNRETFLALEDGPQIVAHNGPSAEKIDIGVGQTVTYSADTGSVTISGQGATRILS